MNPFYKPYKANTISPCYRCIDREIGCHSNCMKYAKFKQDAIKANEEDRKERWLTHEENARYRKER